MRALPLLTDFAVTRLAVRDTPADGMIPARQGASAAVCATATAVRLPAALTTLTIAACPQIVQRARRPHDGMGRRCTEAPSTTFLAATRPCERLTGSVAPFPAGSSNVSAASVTPHSRRCQSDHRASRHSHYVRYHPASKRSSSGPSAMAIRRATRDARRAHKFYTAEHGICLLTHDRPGALTAPGVRSEPAIRGPSPRVTCSSNQTLAHSGGSLAQTEKPRSSEQPGACDCGLGA